MGDVLNRGTKNSPRWYCRFIDGDGRRRQRATGQPTKESARRFVAEIEARISRGQVGIIEPTGADSAKKAITVRALADQFLGDVEGVAGYSAPRIKSIAHYRRDARSIFNTRILPAIGAMTAATVRPSDVERLRDTELATLAPESVIHTLAAISKLYSWARKTGLVDCANPAQGVERPRVEHSVDYLDAPEVGRLLATVERLATAQGATHEQQARWPMVTTAIFAGLRKGELFGLRWRDVAMDAGRLDVLRSYTLAPKSGKARHLPMHAEIVRALRWWRERCPATAEALVFPVEGSPGRLRMGAPEDRSGIGEAFAVAGCHAPADGHRWHCLRHSFASHFAMGGGSLYSLQRLLGHASPAMTQRYAHLSPDHLASEVARLSFSAPAVATVSDLSEARRKRGAE